MSISVFSDWKLIMFDGFCRAPVSTERPFHGQYFRSLCKLCYWCCNYTQWYSVWCSDMLAGLLFSTVRNQLGHFLQTRTPKYLQASCLPISYQVCTKAEAPSRVVIPNSNDSCLHCRRVVFITCTIHTFDSIYPIQSNPKTTKGSEEEATWRRQNPNGWRSKGQTTQYTSGATEAHISASRGAALELNRLVDANKDLLKAKDSNGWTVLHEAVRSNCFDCVVNLLQRGADANALTNDGRSPLHHSKKYSKKMSHNNKISHFLQRYGAREVGPEL